MEFFSARNQGHISVTPMAAFPKDAKKARRENDESNSIKNQRD